MNETGQKKQQLEKEEHLLEKSRQEAQKMKRKESSINSSLAVKGHGAAFERTAAQVAVNEQQCRKTEVLQEKVVQNKNLVNEMVPHTEAVYYGGRAIGTGRKHLRGNGKTLF